MSEKNPLVSVIMPCYNAECLISHSIDSVISQTYSNWELLVIDDCSKDNSATVVKSYVNKDSRIKYLKTDFPSGSPAEPRNIGIKVAQGRFIAFLDSDDLWLPTKLDNQVKTFITTDESDVAVVFSDYEKFSNGEENYENRIVNAPRLVTYKKLLKGNCIGNLTGLLDTEKVGKIFQKKIGHEDYLFWLSCLKPSVGSKTVYKALNTQTVEAKYRQVSTSTSGNKGNAFKWTWNIYYRELRLGLFSSIYHFICYAVKGVLKFIK